MGRTVYFESGISVEDNGHILVMRCPVCNRENYAPAVISGVCCWCGYNAHKDTELRQRMDKYLTEIKSKGQ